MNFKDPQFLAMIFGVLFGVSEALTVIPAVKSNGVFQLIFNILKFLSGHKDDK